MTWYAFKNGHPDINAQGLERFSLNNMIFHGYPTKAEADAHPNSVNALQFVQLSAWDAAHAARVGGGALGGSPKDIATVGSNVFDFSSWFVRGGEILLGLVLLGVGAAKITGTSNIISSALKVAAK